MPQGGCLQKPREPEVRKATAVATVIMVFAALVVWGPPGSASARPKAAAGAAPAANATVELAVADVSPNTPAVSATPHPLTFTLSVTNNTDEPLHVMVSADRSDPIATRTQLEQVMAAPRPPSPDQVSPVRATGNAEVAAAGTATVTIRTFTTTDGFLAREHGWVCLCANAIYPFWFTASYRGTSTSAPTSGTATAQTYLPSFVAPPVHNTVSWIWPLLDRPHRLLQSRVFTDDQLAEELAPGGRLANLLDVLQRVAGSVPLTVVTDPDLIDSIAQMSTGYRVATKTGLIAGTGAADARQWLSQLRTLLTAHPELPVEFTPFADPAVDSLSRAGLSWSTRLPAALRDRVSAAIGRFPTAPQLVWPIERRLAPSTLGSLVVQGARAVVVADRSLTGGTAESTPPSALAPVRSGRGRTLLAVTSGTVQLLTGQVLTQSRAGLGLLPELVSELASQAVQNINANVTAPGYVVIAAPRTLDVDVDVAVRTLEATAHTVWSRPMSVEDAIADPAVPRLDRGTIRIGSEGPSLSPQLLSTLRGVSQMLPPLAQLYHDKAAGAAFVAPFPDAIARCESSSLLADRPLANSFANHLAGVVSATRRAVFIVPPSDKRHRYTLTSKNSLLPVTVVNKLNADVDVRIFVATRGGVPGLTASDEDKKFAIAANSRQQLHIPIHVDRVGSFTVVVRLRTAGPDGLVLGSPTALSVRSTALGAIGVIITVIAAVVLALAVLFRAIRRFRRPSQPPGQVAARDDTPAAVGTE